MSPTLTYVGGPTALLDWRGIRLLTDPTFDPAGTAYELPAYTLRKTQAPAVDVASIGNVDAVLLSHDHHFDNLDHAGRTQLESVARVLTTTEGADRLGGNADGLAPWEQTSISTDDGAVLTITATPARHGPPGGDRGPVIGFALAFADQPDRVVYVSGDTVWFEGVAEVADRFEVRTAILFAGAAQVDVAGPLPLTFTATEALTAARAMPRARIVALHFEGWEHFSESRAELEEAFAAAGKSDRLLIPPAGQPVSLD